MTFAHVLSRFYATIAQGDTEHKAWLKAKCEEFWGVTIEVDSPIELESVVSEGGIRE